MIYIRKSCGWIIITDHIGHHMRYLYHSKREALRRFKNQFNYRYAHGITVIDET